MLTILAIVSLPILVTFAYAEWRAAPWLPTRSRDIPRFLKLADIRPDQKVYDLGCGDGRLVVAAARVGANAEGFEISLLPYLLARVRLLFHRGKNARVRYADFWNRNFSDADVVYLFLTPKANPRMISKLERELKSGAKVVAYVWPLHGWTPSGVDKQESRLDVFLYQR